MWKRIRANSRGELIAGLNSEDTKYWQAGYELGQGLRDKETKGPVKEIPPTATRLFVIHRSWTVIIGYA